MEGDVMIRIAVVEDDPKWVHELETYLKRYEKENGECLDISCFTDGAAIADDYSLNWDIILMDIEMPLMNGMDAAEQIRKRDDLVEIVFITNLTQYAIRGYRVNATDYILKPIEYFSFSQTLKKAISRCSRMTADDFIMVPTKDSIEKIPVHEIRYIDSRGHRITFHLKNREVETTVFSISQLEEKLSPKGFFRCCSGILVNLDAVDSIRVNDAVLGADTVSVSRSRRQAFLSAFTAFLSNG